MDRKKINTDKFISSKLTALDFFILKDDIYYVDRDIKKIEMHDTLESTLEKINQAFQTIKRGISKCEYDIKELNKQRDLMKKHKKLIESKMGGKNE